ncbi:MAG: hypothetical protein WDW38_002165 [Sanguina aurantia]
MPGLEDTDGAAFKPGGISASAGFTALGTPPNTFTPDVAAAIAQLTELPSTAAPDGCLAAAMVLTVAALPAPAQQQVITVAPEFDSNGAAPSFGDTDTLVSKRYRNLQGLAGAQSTTLMLAAPQPNTHNNNHLNIYHRMDSLNRSAYAPNMFIGGDQGIGPVTPVIPYQPLQAAPVIPPATPWLQTPYLSSGSLWNAPDRSASVDSSSSSDFVHEAGGSEGQAPAGAAAAAMSEEKAEETAVFLSELAGLALDPLICKEVLVGADYDVHKATELIMEMLGTKEAPPLSLSLSPLQPWSNSPPSIPTPISHAVNGASLRPQPTATAFRPEPVPAHGSLLTWSYDAPPSAAASDESSHDESPPHESSPRLAVPSASRPRDLLPALGYSWDYDTPSDASPAAGEGSGQAAASPLDSDPDPALGSDPGWRSEELHSWKNGMDNSWPAGAGVGAGEQVEDAELMAALASSKLDAEQEYRRSQPSDWHSSPALFPARAASPPPLPSCSSTPPRTPPYEYHDWKYDHPPTDPPPSGSPPAPTSCAAPPAQHTSPYNPTSRADGSAQHANNHQSGGGGGGGGSKIATDSPSRAVLTQQQEQQRRQQEQLQQLQQLQESYNVKRQRELHTQVDHDQASNAQQQQQQTDPSSGQEQSGSIMQQQQQQHGRSARLACGSDSSGRGSGSQGSSLLDWSPSDDVLGSSSDALATLRMYFPDIPDSELSCTLDAMQGDVFKASDLLLTMQEESSEARRKQADADEAYAMTLADDASPSDDGSALPPQPQLSPPHGHPTQQHTNGPAFPAPSASASASGSNSQCLGSPGHGGPSQPLVRPLNTPRGFGTSHTSASGPAPPGSGPAGRGAGPRAGQLLPGPGRQFGSTFTGIQGQYGAPVARGAGGGGDGGDGQAVTLQQLEQRQTAVAEAEHHWRVLGILQHLFGPAAPKVRGRRPQWLGRSRRRRGGGVVTHAAGGDQRTITPKTPSTIPPFPPLPHLCALPQDLLSEVLTECQGSVQTARANLRAMGLREVAAAAAAPPPPPSVPSFSSSRTAQPGPARRASTHYFTHYPTLNGCSGGSGGGGDAAPAANDAHTVDGRRVAGKVPPSVRADSSGTGPGYDVVPRRSSPPTANVLTEDDDEDSLEDLQVGGGPRGRVTHEQTQALYERARARAHQLTAQRDGLFAASRAAFGEGDTHLARDLSAQAHALTPGIMRCHASAKAKIYAKLNANIQNMWTNDLHGLHPHEALQAIEPTYEFLRRSPCELFT